MKSLKVILCGKLYDGIHAELKENQKILVEGNQIAAVGADLEIPESAEIIDLSDATVTPGMIDAHIHLDYFDWHTIRQEVYDNSEEAKTLAILHSVPATVSASWMSSDPSKKAILPAHAS